MNTHRRELLLLWALLSSCAVATDSASSQDRQWVVTDRDVALRTKEHLDSLGLIDSGAAVFELDTSGGSLATVQLNGPALQRLKGVVHRRYNHCGGFTPHASLEAALLHSRSEVYAADFVLPAAKFDAAVEQQAAVLDMLDEIDSSKIDSVIAILESYPNRHYDTDEGAAAAGDVFDLWTSYAADRSDVTVERFVHDDWKQDSIIARIAGNEKEKEVVVLGAHVDSIYCVNYAGLKRTCTQDHPAPGADDNASGIAAISEVLRVVTESSFRPQRTIDIIAYAAEEEGLKGSRDLIQKKYLGSDREVVGVMQLDMTGFKGSNEDVYFAEDATSKVLTDLVKEMIATYNSADPHRIEIGDDFKCGYACSDHVSWFEEKIHTVFPFEAAPEKSNTAIHTEGDTSDHMRSKGAGHPARFAKLGLEFVLQLGMQHD